MSKLKLIGFRKRKDGYPDTGYYIRLTLSRLDQQERESIKIWVVLQDGVIIDHSTIFFKEKDTAKDFMEMFN